MANRRYNQFFNTLHKMPVLLDCQFTVDATDGNGVTGLVGPGIQNVWMHTSTTPSAGNPNPASGYAVVQLQDNYNKLFGFESAIKSPLSGSSLLVASAGLTIGQPYVITILGTTSLAQWIALGVPAGIAPAVGVVFVAAATSATGTGAVQVPKVGSSGIVGVDLFGNPDLSIQSTAGNNMGVSSGSYLIFRFNGLSFAAGAYTPAGTVAAPVFTGSALGAHTHDLKIIGGQAAAGTDAVSAKTLTLGKEAATDITIAGANSATLGGNVAASAGTPAGTNSAPVFTGSAASLTGTASMIAAAPAAGSVVYLQLYLSNSRILNKGE